MDSKETKDEIEEFEFKPLTEGLGFHQKPLRMGLRDADFIEKPVKPPTQWVEAEPKAAQPARVSPSGSARRTEPASLAAKAAVTSSSPLPKSLPPKSPVSTQKQKSVTISKSAAQTTISQTATESASAAMSVQFHPMASNWPAALVDGVLVAGMGILFLVALLVVTHVDLVGVITSSKIDRLTQLSIAAVFLAVLQLYMVISRSFFGKTLGEWAFDSQLGVARQQTRWFYPLQVFWRTTVIVLTGILVLPLLSAIFRVDLARYLSGVSLQKRSGL